MMFLKMMLILMMMILSWNDDLDGEVVSATPSSSLVERELIEVTKDEVVDEIPTMNKGVSLSCDDLFDDEHTLVLETMISLNSCVEVENEVPLHHDIELLVQVEGDCFSSEEVISIVISKQWEEFSDLVMVSQPKFISTSIFEFNHCPDSGGFVDLVEQYIDQVVILIC
jgi:hypothetical protein